MNNRSDEADDIHGGLQPTDVRETDNIIARVRRKDRQAEYETVRVWRLSPLGVDLVQPSRERYKTGDRLDLQLVVDGKRSQFVGLVVSQISSQDCRTLFGTRLLAESKDPIDYQSEQRHAIRWVCSEHHLPRAIAPSPGRFNEFLLFQIRNISEAGLLLVTGIENSFLIPKMVLTLSINLPMVGDTVQSVEIVWMRIGTDGATDVLEIGVRMTDLEYKTRALLGQYLVQFARDVSLEQLVNSGFSPTNITQGIRFDSVKTEDDYNELLRLRSDSENGNGKLENFVEGKDRLCRLVIGRVGNQVVAAARVRYPELRDRLSCESYQSWDDSYPRSDQLIEVDDIRIDIEQEFEAQTILALFNYICTACTSDSRQNVLVYSNKYKLFEVAGWKVVANSGETYALIGNAYQAIRGKLTDPFKWNLVWRRSAAFMLKAGTLQPKGTDALILKIYMSLGPLADAWAHCRSILRKQRSSRTHV